MNNGKAKNTDNFDYTERHIDEMSIVLVNTTPAPENRFQRQVCEVLYGALHGLVFHTDDFELLKRNVMTALQRIDKVCPRKNRRMSTFYSELGTDSLGRLRYVNTLEIGEIVESKDVFIRTCVVKFMPIQGLLYKTEEVSLISSHRRSVPTALCGQIIITALWSIRKEVSNESEAWYASCISHV